MIKRFKENHYTDNYQAYPCAEFSHKQILSYMKMHRLPMPVMYSLATASEDAKVGKGSNGIGFNLDFFLWARKNFPQDLERVYEVFPLSRRILAEYDYKNNSGTKKEHS